MKSIDIASNPPCLCPACLQKLQGGRLLFDIARLPNGGTILVSFCPENQTGVIYYAAAATWWTHGPVAPDRWSEIASQSVRLAATVVAQQPEPEPERPHRFDA